LAITDEGSARAWAQDQRHEAQIALAARCALRALPGIAPGYNELLAEIALPILRAILTAAVATTRPDPEAGRAARAAAEAAANCSTSADNAYSAASDTTDPTYEAGAIAAFSTPRAVRAAFSAASVAAAGSADATARAADFSAHAVQATDPAPYAHVTLGAADAARAAYSEANSDADLLIAKESPALLFS
jgi:hypothetical protein